MQDIVDGVRSVRSRGGGKGEWFPDKIQGHGVGKNLFARAGVGMESN